MLKTLYDIQSPFHNWIEANQLIHP